MNTQEYTPFDYEQTISPQQGETERMSQSIPIDATRAAIGDAMVNAHSIYDNDIPGLKSYVRPLTNQEIHSAKVHEVDVRSATILEMRQTEYDLNATD